MVYATNPRFLAISEYACSGFAGFPGLQRAQSPVRKRPALPGPWNAVSKHDHIRSAAAGPTAHLGRQPVCFVFGRNHQRDDAQHHDHKRSAVAGYNPSHPAPRPRNSQRDSQYPKRNFRRPRMYKRRHQPFPRLDDHLRQKVAQPLLFDLARIIFQRRIDVPLVMKHSDHASIFSEAR
jgi:hypothetical protein